MNDNTDKTQTIWVEEKENSNFMKIIWDTLKWILLFIVLITLLLSFFGWVTTSNFSGSLNNVDQNVKNLTL